MLSSSFINMCIYKMKAHPNSTILHNQIKNILVEFLPKIPDVLINVVLKSECELLRFVER